MAFPTRPESVIQNIESGIETDVNNIVYNADVFEDQNRCTVYQDRTGLSARMLDLCINIALGFCNR